VTDRAQVQAAALLAASLQTGAYHERARAAVPRNLICRDGLSADQGTGRLVDPEVLRRIKPPVHFGNVARVRVTDEAAPVEALTAPASLVPAWT
jgi:hypothetical protein